MDSLKVAEQIRIDLIEGLNKDYDNNELFIAIGKAAGAKAIEHLIKVYKIAIKLSESGHLDKYLIQFQLSDLKRAIESDPIP